MQDRQALLLDQLQRLVGVRLELDDRPPAMAGVGFALIIIRYVQHTLDAWRGRASEVIPHG